jgi:hypothetical protein
MPFELAADRCDHVWVTVTEDEHPKAATVEIGTVVLVVDEASG